MNRRSFAYQLAAASIALPFTTACGRQKKPRNEEMKEVIKPSEPNISLAQWSHNKEFFKGEMDPRDFAKIARRDYEIEAIEYVNQFYTDHAKDQSFWREMKQRADDLDVKSLLIMVDDEGELGSANQNARSQAVENHYKWVDAASILGCHSIRVNAFGAEDKETFRSAIVDGMSRLCAYASKEEINVIIENHGLHSSNAGFIVEIIEEVGMENFGTFPDFGNWCMSAMWGSIQGDQCVDSYNIYQGVREFMPYAKAVSAKSYEFDEEGNETTIDYYQVLKHVKEASYEGYIGIEYEGEQVSPSEGIRKTRELIRKAWIS